MKKEEYIQILTDQIRCKKARKKVAQEICTHIEEQEVAYLAAGMEKSEAEQAAVQEMGDPVEAGAALDMIHKPQIAWGWIAVIALLHLTGFGILVFLEKNCPNKDFIPGSAWSHVRYLPVGLGLMIGACYADYSRIGYHAKEITLLMSAFLFAGVQFFGTNVNGAVRWIYGIPLNLNLVIYLFVPLYAAVLYQYRGEGKMAIFKGILWMCPALLAACSASGVITVLTLFLVLALVLSFAVYRRWFRVSAGRTLAGLWGSVVLILAALCIKILHAGAAYQIARLKAMLNPDRSEAGYTTRMLRSIASESLFMSGSEEAQHTAQKLWAGQNFTWSYMLAYFGILAAVLFIGLVLLVVLRLMHTSVRQKNQLGMIMGVGCSLVFLVQVPLYVLVNLGLLPLGTVYCPFITYGGTGICVTSILLGLLLSIYRYQDVPLEMEGKKYHLSVRLEKSE